jgi:hypothetical protein
MNTKSKTIIALLLAVSASAAMAEDIDTSADPITARKEQLAAALNNEEILGSYAVCFPLEDQNMGIDCAKQVQEHNASVLQKDDEAVAAEDAKRAKLPKPRIGMNKAQFDKTEWGAAGKRHPTSVNRTVVAGHIHEQYVMEGGGLYFYFDNGILTGWQD